MILQTIYNIKYKMRTYTIGLTLKTERIIIKDDIIIAHRTMVRKFYQRTYE